MRSTTKNGLIEKAFRDLQSEFSKRPITKIADEIAGRDIPLAKAFARHAISEATGAAIIEAVADYSSTPLPEFSDDLYRHAEDEKRHAKIFSALAIQLWPEIATAGTQFVMPNVDVNAENFGGDIGAFIWATNAAETRNLFWLGKYQSNIKCLRPSVREGLSNALRSIHEDEKRHVSYTRKWGMRFVEAGNVDPGFVTTCSNLYRSTIWWEVSVAAFLLSEENNLDSSADAWTQSTGLQPLLRDLAIELSQHPDRLASLLHRWATATDNVNAQNAATSASGASSAELRALAEKLFLFEPDYQSSAPHRSAGGSALLSGRGIIASLLLKNLNLHKVDGDVGNLLLSLARDIDLDKVSVRESWEAISDMTGAIALAPVH